MKIELNEEAATTTTIITCALIFFLFCLSGCQIERLSDKDKVDKGLIQKPITTPIGHVEFYWTKE